LQDKGTYFNKQGWGYKDTEFELDTTKQMVKVKGDRYLYSGKYLPELINFAETHVKTDFKQPRRI
jgi:hypothetical protein